MCATAVRTSASSAPVCSVPGRASRRSASSRDTRSGAGVTPVPVARWTTGARAPSSSAGGSITVVITHGGSSRGKPSGPVLGGSSGMPVRYSRTMARAVASASARMAASSAPGSATSTVSMTIRPSSGRLRASMMSVFWST